MTTRIPDLACVWVLCFSLAVVPAHAADGWCARSWKSIRPWLQTNMLGLVSLTALIAVLLEQRKINNRLDKTDRKLELATAFSGGRSNETLTKLQKEITSLPTSKRDQAILAIEELAYSSMDVTSFRTLMLDVLPSASPELRLEIQLRHANEGFSDYQKPGTPWIRDVAQDLVAKPNPKDMTKLLSRLTEMVAAGETHGVSNAKGVNDILGNKINLAEAPAFDAIEKAVQNATDPKRHQELLKFIRYLQGTKGEQLRRKVWESELDRNESDPLFDNDLLAFEMGPGAPTQFIPLKVTGETRPAFEKAAAHSNGKIRNDALANLVADMEYDAADYHRVIDLFLKNPLPELPPSTWAPTYACDELLKVLVEPPEGIDQEKLNRLFEKLKEKYPHEVEKVRQSLKK